MAGFRRKPARQRAECVPGPVSLRCFHPHSPARRVWVSCSGQAPPALLLRIDTIRRAPFGAGHRDGTLRGKAPARDLPVLQSWTWGKGSGFVQSAVPGLPGLLRQGRVSWRPIRRVGILSKTNQIGAKAGHPPEGVARLPPPGATLRRTPPADLSGATLAAVASPRAPPHSPPSPFLRKRQSARLDPGTPGRRKHQDRRSCTTRHASS